jgi:hypothetical protein
MYGAQYEGNYPKLNYYHADLSEVDKVSEILKKVKPKVICSTAILRASYLAPSIPREKLHKIEALGYKGRAPLYSLFLYCPLKLMQAIELSGIETKSVITNYPDVTCAVLKNGFGLEPTVGGGNIDLAIPMIKKIVNEKLNVPLQNISIYLVAHHAWVAGVNRYNVSVPYWIKIFVGGDDVTEQFPPTYLCNSLQKIHDTSFLYPKSPLGLSAKYYQQFIASSFVQNILAIYFNTGKICHAPGPCGLPGGYPVRLSADGAEVYLPKEITLEEAIKINNECGKYDGIERIEDNGTVICTDGSYLEAKMIEETALKIFSLL